MAIVWLDSILHYRAIPTNLVNGGDISQTKSPLRPRVKQLTNLCWYLFAPPPSTSDLEVGYQNGLPKRSVKLSSIDKVFKPFKNYGQ